jgi:pimeloyl-ACP methyl ester carboxylesterase
VSLLPPAAEPKRVMAPDGVQLATYDHGDPDAPVVLAVHGFASSAYANWVATGWVRELNRAGHRVLALDQRGHGRSGKPHEPSAYSMALLVQDVRTVLDAYLVDEAVYVGYSLGARVGWHASIGGEHAISRAVLGGIPDGDPLTRFRVDDAKAFIADGTPVEDRLTGAYLTMAEGIPGNDLAALVALVEGMRGGEQPDPANPPQQPVLFAAGSEDPILAASERLAAAAPLGEFFRIEGRNHFNAPTARAFRTRALEFLSETSASTRTPTPSQRTIAALVFDAAGRLLLSERDGGLETPGGAPRPDETDADALRRLIREQLGVDASLGGVAWVDYSAGTPVRLHVAAAREASPSAVPVPIGPGLEGLRPLALRDLLLSHGSSIAGEAAALT